MSTLVVSYRPRPECADENQRLWRRCSAELAVSQPPGFRYSTVRLADGRFLHTAHVDGENPLPASPAFAAFQQGIADRCEPGEGPAPQPATLVGTYPRPDPPSRRPAALSPAARRSGGHRTGTTCCALRQCPVLRGSGAGGHRTGTTCCALRQCPVLRGSGAGSRPVPPAAR